MIRSEYRGIDKLVLERAFIQTYQCMGVWTYGRANETIIFDQGVRKYVRVTLIMTFDQVYVTNHNYN